MTGDTPASGPPEFCLFEVCRQVCALPVVEIRRVLDLQHCVPVVQPPDYSSGWAAVPDGILSVIDLRAKFGGRSGFTAATRLIGVTVPDPAGGTREIGLLVDFSAEAPAVVTGAVLRANGPLAALQPWIVGWLLAGGRVVPLLDPVRLFEPPLAAAPRRRGRVATARGLRVPGRKA